MDHNEDPRNNYNIHDKARNLAISIKNQLQLPNQLPQHCRLIDPENYRHLYNFEKNVYIDFTTPHSNHKGAAIIFHPESLNKYVANLDLNGYVHMLCTINAFNGYFMELTVNSREDMLEVLEFCQLLLEYQPDEDELDFVRIPDHMQNHWCVEESRRQRHIRL